MTTAAVVAYYSREGEASVSYAGHPPVAYKRTTDNAWSFARPPVHNVQGDAPPINIPLAVAPDTLYGQLTIPLAPGDRLFVYTDGITEASSPEGDVFGYARLKDVLDANTNAPLAELKSAVLRAVHQHAKKALTHDDVTLIALEIC
jgi:sigma-B regulation protein RsbU (phosphoserine phosphatase)